MDGDVVEGCGVDNAVAGDEVSEWSENGVIGVAEQNALVGFERPVEVRLAMKSPYTPFRQPTFAGAITKYLIQSYRFRERRVEESIVDLSSTKIQGIYFLPRGYSLAYVPHDVEVRPRFYSLRQLHPTISSSINIPRILFSLLQTIAGGMSLYHTKGAQIKKWGYAAYGLTVIPYMFISVINLLGSLVSSEYGTVVLVHSRVMEEMVQRGGVVEGVVGIVEGEEGVGVLGREVVKFSQEGGCLKGRRVGSFRGQEEPFAVLPMETPKPAPAFPLGFHRWHRRQSKKQREPTLTIPSHPPFTRLPPPRHQPLLNILSLFLYISAYVGPYLIIYGLTHFRHNQSRSDKYSATIIWLVYGQLSAVATTVKEKASGRRGLLSAAIWAFTTYGAAGLLGYTRVVQMMREGNCPP
ncbi:MAG: hypothetical protein M1840_005179 [Geoglossum simile]|nr:MAG: hypothetical protein M1840_005179 [Geoglossum simile]